MLRCRAIASHRRTVSTPPLVDFRAPRLWIFLSSLQEAFSRYMPKYIPGNPEIAVQAMPAAGSLVAANYVYNVAKPDGLTLRMVQYNISTWTSE
jgi:hypothetical protein